MLHEFVGGPRGWGGRLGALTDRQVGLLRGLQRPTVPAARVDPARAGGGPVELRDGDQAMLGVLARDGRAGHGELAAATGWSASTVRRRLESLRQAGALYFDVEVDARLLGFAAEANLWLAVAPSELVTVGNALASHVEVPFAAATTGPTNLTATVVCRDPQALYRYLTERIGALAAVRQVETAPRIRTLKRAGTLDPRWAH